MGNYTGKYYLVNAGYPQVKRYLAPYKGGVKYHLPDFQRGGPPVEIQKHFNRAHSSLRGCVERSIGLWKVKFKILRKISSFSFEKQRDIVIATIALHNFLRRSKTDSAFALLRDHPNYCHVDVLIDKGNFQGNEGATRSASREMDVLRDEIARALMENVNVRILQGDSIISAIDLSGT